MCLLRSVGSKQIRSDPFGFLTVTNEFNHSGAGPEIESYFEIIPAFSILSNSSLNGHFIASSTFLGGFWIGCTLSFKVILTGGTLNLPIPLNRCLYFGWFTIQSLVSVDGIVLQNLEISPETESKLFKLVHFCPVQDWWMGQLKFTSWSLWLSSRPMIGLQSRIYNKEFHHPCVGTTQNSQSACTQLFDPFVVVSNKSHRVINGTMQKVNLGLIFYNPFVEVVW